MQPPSIVIGYPHANEVSAYFARSLVDAAIAGTTASAGYQLEAVVGKTCGVLVAQARNLIVKTFLAEHTSPWLLLIDADMYFSPEHIGRLVDLAVEFGAEVVGGHYVGHSQGICFPQAYIFADDSIGRIDEPLPPRSMFEVAGTGGGFLLVSRAVLEAVRDQEFSKAFPWFQETELGDLPIGEDMTFCLRAREVGYKVYVATEVEVGHHKSHGFTPELHRQQAASTRR